MTLIGGYPYARFATEMAEVSTVPLDMDRIFVQTDTWGTGEWNDVVASINAERTVIVSTKLSGTWANAATGSNDARLDAVVNGLVALDVSDLAGTPCLSFNHEPENDGPSPADYNKMWRHFDQRYAAKLRAAGWDLAYIFMGGTWRGWTPWSIAQLEQSIAGTSVTKVYADIYEKPGTPWATKAWTDPDSTSSPFRAYADWCEAKGYEAGLPEVGVNRKQVDDGSQATFLDALASSKIAGMADLFIYYDRDVGEGGATSNTRLLRPDAFEAFGGLYDAVVTPPPPPSGDCSEVEAELAATKATLTATAAELAATKADLTEALAHLASTTSERDEALAKIDAAVAVLS
jgi:hypothetical protein